MNSKVLELNDKNFDKEVLESDVPVLVDFWAPWCGPCKMLSPVIEELAMEYEGRAKICKVNVDENSETSIEYKIRSVPTVLIFSKGYIIESLQGSQSKNKYIEVIEEHLSS